MPRRIAVIMSIGSVVVIAFLFSWLYRWEIRSGEGITMIFSITEDSRLSIPVSLPSQLVVEQVQRRLAVEKRAHIRVNDAGAGRVEVWLQYSNDAQRAYAEFENARSSFEETTVDMRKVEMALAQDNAYRQDAIDNFFSNGSQRRPLLKALAVARDAVTKLEQEEKQFRTDKVPVELWAKDQQVRAEAVYAENQLKDASLSWTELDSHLKDEKNGVRGSKDALDALAGQHPDQKMEIEAVVRSCRALFAESGGSPNPEEVAALVLPPDEAEFRIAVKKQGLKQQEIEEALARFAEDGAGAQIDVGGIAAKWFLMKPFGKIDMDEKDTCLASFNGQNYLLLYDTPERKLTHERVFHSWMMSVAPPYDSPDSGWVLPFKLDPIGGSYMSAMTNANQDSTMAIVVGGDVICAPHLNGRIDADGEITLGTTRTDPKVQVDATALRQILLNSELPAAPLRFVQVK